MLLKQHCFIALTTAQLVKDQENFEENQTEQNTTIDKLRNRYSRYAGDEFRMWNRIQNTWEKNMFFPNRKGMYIVHGLGMKNGQVRVSSLFMSESVILS